MSSTQGADNDHVLLKHADVEDDGGMMKYAVDLNQDLEKTSSLNLNKEDITKED